MHYTMKFGLHAQQVMQEKKCFMPNVSVVFTVSTHIGPLKKGYLLDHLNVQLAGADFCIRQYLILFFSPTTTKDISMLKMFFSC